MKKQVEKTRKSTRRLSKSNQNTKKDDHLQNIDKEREIANNLALEENPKPVPITTKLLPPNSYPKPYPKINSPESDGEKHIYEGHYHSSNHLNHLHHSRVSYGKKFNLKHTHSHINS